MRQFPRRKLCEIIAQYGVSVSNDPIRCEGLLSDFCGGYKKEVFILVCALKQNVPADLLNFSGKIPMELIMVQISNRLRNDLSLNKSAARWGTESWALALGLVSAADLSKRMPHKKPHKPLSRDLPNSSEAKGTLIVKPDNTRPSLNPTTTKKDNGKFFRRVGLMVLMMCVGLVMGWVLSIIY